MPTTFDPQKHHRRSIRLKEYDYTQPGAYFITICTHKWTLLFGDVVDGEMRLNDLGRVAHREWARLTKRFRFLEFGPFVVMPNHLHGLLIISADDNPRAPNDGHSNPISGFGDDRGGTALNEKDPHAENLRRAPTDGGGNPCRGTARDAGVSNPEKIHRDQENPFVEGIRRAPNDGHSNPITEFGDARTEAFGHPVPGSIPTIVRSYKSSVTWQINRLTGRPNHPVWQRNYYEHVVRDNEAMEKIIAYIAGNPRQWDEDRINPKFFRE